MSVEYRGKLLEKEGLQRVMAEVGWTPVSMTSDWGSFHSQKDTHTRALVLGNGGGIGTASASSAEQRWVDFTRGRRAQSSHASLLLSKELPQTCWTFPEL